MHVILIWLKSMYLNTTVQGLESLLSKQSLKQSPTASRAVSPSNTNNDNLPKNESPRAKTKLSFKKDQSASLKPGQAKEASLDDNGLDSVEDERE